MWWNGLFGSFWEKMRLWSWGLSKDPFQFLSWRAPCERATYSRDM